MLFSVLLLLTPDHPVQGQSQRKTDKRPQWRIPRSAPLLTQWGRAVTPKNVHREYPRPQFVRKEWLNLNGLWEYEEADSASPPPVGRQLAGTILVPFPIESALSGVMKSAERLWYRTTFTLPAGWKGRRILLHFGAVDWEATVYLNGREVGTHRGGYDSFAFDVTTALSEGKSQELIVNVYDPSDAGDQPRGKQVRKPEGIWYTSTTGIWQTVWLEPVAATYLSDVAITPDVDSSMVVIVPNVGGAAGGETVRATVSAAGSRVAASAGPPGDPMKIRIPRPNLWSPDDPFLYDLTLELMQGGKRVDLVRSYFAMRSVKIAKDERGIPRIILNGSFQMQIGPLDQGFWPDGLYAAPSDAALKYDIVMMRKLGFTMARKHVKVEPDRWYYWADRLGLLVWQDMPSGNNTTPGSRTQFEHELGRLIAAHRNHPSIIMWVIFNEGWGQYDTERLASWVHQADPSRLVNSASGWDDKGTGDLKDIHSYPQPKAPEADSVRAIVLGEFGGLGLAVSGHTWKKEHWGYRGMESVEQLTSLYEAYLDTVYQLMEHPGLSAAVYTQITDVEIECNGLLTYDRAVVKPSLQRIARANRGHFSLLRPSRSQPAGR
ncbi:MAG: sugar-binding domain-containing protein [Bacteroidota bacterium]